MQDNNLHVFYCRHFAKEYLNRYILFVKINYHSLWEAKMEYKEITEKVIGCAFRVYNKMGFGFLENVYEKCMQIELKKLELEFGSQKPVNVYYDDEIVGEYIADIIVNDLIIIELKSVRRIVKAHEMQLVNYLTATQKPVGLIINFGEQKVEIKRKVKDIKA